MWFWWMLYGRVFVCGLWDEEEEVWRCWCLGKGFAVGVDVGRVMDELVCLLFSRNFKRHSSYSGSYPAIYLFPHGLGLPSNISSRDPLNIQPPQL
jgi:hypothetical protein